MATRIYLPSSGAAPVTPSTWNHANQAGTTYTCAGVRTKGSTAMTSRTTASGTTNPYTRAVMRYVIGPIYAVQISGTVNAVMRCSEANNAANATMSIAVKIIKPDGTDRSVLLAAIASDLGGGVQEFSTSLYGRRAWNVTETRPIPLTAQTPTDGDYLVIELGFRSASGTTYNVLMRHGDNSASDMVDEDGSNTNDYAPFVDFSSDIAFVKSISVTDSGIGTDAVAGVLVKVSQTDVGVGTDAVASVLRRAVIADTGAGADAVGIRARIGGLPLSPWSRCKRIDLPIPTANLTDFPVEVPIVAGSPASIAIGAACRADGFDIRFTTDDGATLLPYERESWSGGGGSPATAIFWVKTNVATAGTYVWCYSDDTDILTEDGWKNIKDVVENESVAKLATLNPDTNSVEYHRPEKFFKVRHQGNMLHQGGKGIDFLVTPNHRVYARPCWRQTGDRKPNAKEFGLIKADELPRNVEYRRDFPYEGQEVQTFTLPGYPHTTENHTRKEKQYAMDDFLRVFGIWIAEGSLQKNGTIDISQKQAKKTKVIKGWVEKLGYKPGETKDGVYFCDTQLNRWLKQFGHSTDKFIPAEFKSLSKRQLRILLDAMIFGDGSKRGEPKNDCSYATISRQLADDVQEIALKCGYTATLSKRLPKNNVGSFKSDNILYVITLAEKCKFPKPNDHKDQREWVDYDGYTYCVEVPNHIVFVRRNGKALWNGNCYFGNAAAPDVSSGPAVFIAPHVAVYHMNDLTTSTILDSTANNNDGAKKGAGEPAEADGKVGKGQSFDAVDDYITATPAVSGLTNATLETWIKQAAQENNVSPLYIGNTGADGVWGIRLFANGGIGADFWTEGNATTAPYIPLDTWYHVSITFNGTTKLVYFNGVQRATATSGATAVNAATACIGGNGKLWLNQFSGLVDEVRISSIARSADWIAYEYANMNAADGGLVWGEGESGPLADSGIGTDAVALVTAKLGIADAGSGTDIVSKLDARLTVSDLGQGADAVGLISRVEIQELLRGDDAISIVTQKFIQDTGLGTEYVFGYCVKGLLTTDRAIPKAAERTIEITPTVRSEYAKSSKRSVTVKRRRTWS